MEIPYQRLSQEALQALVEEYVTREATDYGEHEVPLATKVTQVLAQLRNGRAVIRYDPGSDSVGLFPAE